MNENVYINGQDVYKRQANDLPLFQAADESYAVANAVPELKAAASGIIPSNEEDGVARWLAAHWELFPVR